jgi:protein gp37
MMNRRFGNGHPFDNSPVEFEIVEKQYRKPEDWGRPRAIFVQSMGDLFHDAIPYEMIDRVMRMPINAPQHTYLILTKRIDRALHYFTRGAYRLTDRMGCTMTGGFDESGMLAIPDNVRVGVSACNQDEVWKIEKLAKIPAVHFLSLEPILEGINLSSWLLLPPFCIDCRTELSPRSKIWNDGPKQPCPHCGGYGYRFGKAIDQVIVGAETGPGARKMDLNWARSIRDQCTSAGVPFFFKRDSDGNRELDGRLWEEMPE